MNDGSHVASRPIAAIVTDSLWLTIGWRVGGAWSGLFTLAAIVHWAMWLTVNLFLSQERRLAGIRCWESDIGVLEFYKTFSYELVSVVSLHCGCSRLL